MGWPNVEATVGVVRFGQYLPSLDARCSLCDWSQPWNGWTIMAHAESHGQDIGCLECGVATLNLGLDARCHAHGGPDRCPKCLGAYGCYSSCENSA
jgi:hypothetical protein